MKIAIACGGTGGHIFPGVATATELKRRGHEIQLWLAGKDIEAPALRDWRGEMFTVNAEGLPTGFSLQALRAIHRLVLAIGMCREIMKQHRPDVMLAMGSYASVGPAFAALWLGVPLVLHEANVIPGRAILLLSRWATQIAISFEKSRVHFPNREVVVTGMPLRPEIERAAQRARRFRETEEPWTLLVMGGSRGAHRLNEIVSQALVRLYHHDVRFRVIHLTGAADESYVKDLYQKEGVPHQVYAFVSDMAPILSAADFAICRAGAATCAELSAMGIPALFVPYPFAARNHQWFNAKALEESGAADVIAEQDLTEDWLVRYLLVNMQNPTRWQQMAHNMKAQGRFAAASVLADLVEKVGLGLHVASS